jgi:hypothetical protein
VTKKETKATPEPPKAVAVESPAITSAAPARPAEKAVDKEAAKPAAPAATPPADKVTEKEPARPALASTSPAGAPVLKKKKAQARVRLFNGVDLNGFDTYLGVPYGGTSKTAYGLNNDPERVFAVRNGELHISGKVSGGLISTREYENYRLIVEYKWGEKKWPPRSGVPRLGGIVLHATGEPGALHGWSMVGITCVIGETGSGALFLSDDLPKTITLHAEAERLVFKKGPNTLVYKPGAALVSVHSGYLHAIGWRPPLLAAKLAPGKVAPELAHPVGEWNRLECLCEGDRITVILNGTTVNVATKVSQTKGKLFIESQGAEIAFRTIVVRPLGAAAPASAGAKSARP